MYWSDQDNQHTSIEPDFVDPTYDGCSLDTRDRSARNEEKRGTVTYFDKLRTVTGFR